MVYGECWEILSLKILFVNLKLSPVLIFHISYLFHFGVLIDIYFWCYCTYFKTCAISFWWVMDVFYFNFQL